MSNFDTVVLDGEMGLFTTIREGDLPYYTGATEVTPSDQTQTLQTADTIVTSNITVNPVPGEYIDTTDATLDDASLLPSGVTAYADGVKYTGTAAINDDGDLVVSGDTVTVPAGFYEEPAAASVASGSATTPATSITANPSISVGNDGSITASVSATQSVTPSVTAGYVSSGTAGTITVSGSGSSQLSTQAGTTITPTTSQQTAVAAGKFMTGAVIVDAMPSGTAGTPTATKGTVSNHSVSVTPSVTNTTGYITGGTKTGTAVTVSASELVSGSQNITSNDTYDVTNLASVTVAVPGDTPTLQTKSVSYTPTESAQSATVTADQGYDGLDEVNISVGAISSSYVGSAIDRRDSTDLSASGATVTAPAGFYESAATKSVASGTAGTPSATKGSVSNHSVSVTPSVTNTAGYISGGTISGTAVTVDVTELESGTKSITENGTGISVSGYSAVDVNVSGGGGISVDGMAAHTEPTGAITITVGPTKIMERAFNYTPITSVTITNNINIPGQAFANCSNLTTINSSSVTSMGGNQNLSNCTSLTTVNLPEIKTLANNAFQGCTSLQVFDLPKLTSLNYTRCLYGCSNLKTIVLRSTSIIPVGSDTLTNTPFGSGGSGGTIYIPKVLYDALGTGTNDYKAASNWSTIDGYGTITWAKIEGSQYENYYADGTAIPTT